MIRVCIYFALGILFVADSTSFAQNRVTIGIGEIINQTRRSEADKNRQAWGLNKVDDDTRAFQDMLNTALIKTMKFDVIERARLDEILKEQGLSSETGLVDGGVELGGVQGVDYLLYGSITQLGVDDKGIGLGGKFAMGSKKTTMAVDIKIVDAQTGRSLIADSVEEEVSAGRAIQLEGFQQSSSDGDSLGDVMRLTADSVVKVIVSAIYPVKVISVSSSGVITLNYGKGLIEDGAYFDVFATGEELIDPDTGEVLGSEEELIGRIVVNSVQAKFSKAEVVDGNASIFEAGSICRPVDMEEVKKASKKAEKENRKKLPF